MQGERTLASTTSQVLPVDAAGVQPSDQPLTIYDGSAKTGGRYGLYVQDEFKLLPNVTLNYGARFDLVDEYTHEHQLSPRVNMVWQATESTTLHVGYSRYFTPQLDVLNVTDAKYEIRDGTGVGVGAPQYGLRRTILAGLTQRF